MRKIFIGILLCAVLPNEVCFGETSGVYRWISDYIAILEKGPTIADGHDYDFLYGEHNFELMICEERGWKINDSDMNCEKFFRKRYENESTYPSVHMMWIRSKLPMNPKIKILKEWEYTTGTYTYLKVQAMLDDVDVVFGLHASNAPFGYVSVEEIDGVSLRDLLKQDRVNGFSPSIYLEKESRE